MGKLPNHPHLSPKIILLVTAWKTLHNLPIQNLTPLQTDGIREWLRKWKKRVKRSILFWHSGVRNEMYTLNITEYYFHKFCSSPFLLFLTAQWKHEGKYSTDFYHYYIYNVRAKTTHSMSFWNWAFWAWYVRVVQFIVSAHLLILYHCFVLTMSPLRHSF